MDKLVMEVKGLNSLTLQTFVVSIMDHQYTLLRRCLVLGVCPPPKVYYIVWLECQSYAPKNYEKTI